jgi:acyl-CoA thioester hydrolase
MKEKSEVFEYRLEVGQRHLDHLGHVNNAAYFQMFEEARWAMIEPKGWGREDVVRRQISPILLQAGARFKRELRLGDKVLIQTCCHAYKGKMGQVSQVMLRPDGKEACLGEFNMALMDLKTRKLISPPLDWFKAVGLE